MLTNVFAYTAPGSEYPEFMSVNDREGRIEVTVRGPVDLGGRYPMPGAIATMTLPSAYAVELMHALKAHIAGAG